MSRDRLQREAFTQEEAEDLVKHVVRERERWGKHYTGDDIGIDKILDCLIFMSTAETAEVRELRETVTRLNRQGAAYKAREARYKKLLAEAKGVEVDVDED